MRALKYVIYAVATVVVLVVVAGFALAYLVDANQFKAPIERAVKDATQRTLRLEGPLHLTFFPSIGLATGKATLSERNSTAQFASLRSAEVSVAVLPLLNRSLVVNAVRLDGLHVDLVRGKNGSSNYGDLLPGAAAAPSAGEHKPSPAAASPLKLDVSSIRIENAAIAYRDEKTGRSFGVSNLDVRTGRIAPDVPGKLSLDAKLKSTNPALEARVQLSGGYRLNFARAAYDLSDLHIDARGMLDREPFEAKLAAPKLSLASGRASGADVSGTLRLDGAKRKASTSFEVSGIQGSEKSLAVSKLAAEFEASFGERSVKGGLSSPLRADLAAQSFDLPALSAHATLADPTLPQKKLSVALSGSARAELAKHEASARLAGRIDESEVKATLALAPITPPHFRFDVGINRLDLDRYLGTAAKAGAAAPTKPAPARGGGETRLDFSALDNLNAQGELRIGALTVRHLKLADVKARIRAANGRLDLSPYSAALYQGSLAGALALDARGNRVAAKDTLSNVAIGPLLRDLSGRDALEGRGNVALDVTAAGASVEAMKTSLAGTARVHLRDGAIKGINLAATLRKAQAFLGAKSAQQQAADQTQQTDFSELSASFAIRNGVAHNDDLSVKSPFFRIGGAGDIDVGASRIDYLAKATVVASARGQGGPELAKLAGLTVPVRLSGPFDAVKYRLDLGAVAAELAKSQLRQKLEQKLQGAPNQGGAGGEVRNLLKGIFGR